MLPILELRNLSKQFPTHRAVDGISLEIPKGAFFSLLGPSGCGKTTTLRLIAGFEDPTSGDVLLNGTRINDHKPYQRNVSTVFQNYALFPHLTVRQNIEFGLRRRGSDKIGERAGRAIDLVQLTGKEARYPAQISGGERQRVALARSLVLEPDVLLLDEPLSALDPKLRKQMRVELKSLQRSVGITFLFITHDQEEALSLSDQMALMNQGRIEQSGTPRELYLRPRTRFAAGFLGAVNWVNGIGVRPEATRISRDCPAPPARPVEAQVVQSTFLGNCIHVELRLVSGETVVAEVSRLCDGSQPGQRVYVWWDPADELSFS